MGKGKKPTQQELAANLVRLSAVGCWSWAGKHDAQGYAVLRGWRVARLLWQQALGKALPKGTGLYTTCNNPRCVNPQHMKPGTGKGQKHDISNRKYGDDHYSTVVSDADVAEMRRRYADRTKPVTQTQLAKEYGISQAQVSRILTGVRRRGKRPEF